MKISTLNKTFDAHWIVFVGLALNLFLGLGNVFFAVTLLKPLSGLVGIFNLGLFWVLLGCVGVYKK